MSVGKLVPGNVVTARPDNDLESVAERFAEEHVGAVVVTEDGEPTGIVTLDDLVATIGEQLENVSETIEVQSPGYSL
ncbi:CBS domain-containing protein [Natronococcus roseus]|uniref:CBS domain-containing protein n=1 Tax=Natronococcus roseus TaxID=1052014 RepID=UPI00374CCC45